MTDTELALVVTGFAKNLEQAGVGLGDIADTLAGAAVEVSIRARGPDSTALWLFGLADTVAATAADPSTKN